MARWEPSWSRIWRRGDLWGGLKWGAGKQKKNLLVIILSNAKEYDRGDSSPDQTEFSLVHNEKENSH